MTTPVDSARRFYDALGSGDAPPSAIERADARPPTTEESTDRLAAPEQLLELVAFSAENRHPLFLKML